MHMYRYKSCNHTGVMDGDWMACDPSCVRWIYCPHCTALLFSREERHRLEVMLLHATSTVMYMYMYIPWVEVESCVLCIYNYCNMFAYMIV